MRKSKGAILIVALWMLAILTVFAVGLGHRMSMEIKIVGFYLDRLKAESLAKAGLRRAIEEKAGELRQGMSTDIDALSESWANNPELFKKISLGDGTYTVSYEFMEEETEKKEAMTLYGMMDEESRININTAPFEVLTNLFLSKEHDASSAKGMAAAIIDWRDEDSYVGVDPDTKLPIGAEDEYYQDLKSPYNCKNKEFEIVEELFLVKGITPEVFYGEDIDEDGILEQFEVGIQNSVTVHGSGKVNINTGSRTVLAALFGEAFAELPDRIIEYRRGMDGDIGTDDDRWFGKGKEILIDRGEAGGVEVKNLDAEWTPDPFLGVTPIEWKKIKDLTSGDKPIISVASTTFRVQARAEVDRVVKDLTAVVTFQPDGKSKIIYWREY